MTVAMNYQIEVERPYPHLCKIVAERFNLTVEYDYDFEGLYNPLQGHSLIEMHLPHLDDSYTPKPVYLGTKPEFNGKNWETFTDQFYSEEEDEDGNQVISHIGEVKGLWIPVKYRFDKYQGFDIYARFYQSGKLQTSSFAPEKWSFGDQEGWIYIAPTTIAAFNDQFEDPSAELIKVIKAYIADVVAYHQGRVYWTLLEDHMTGDEQVFAGFIGEDWNTNGLLNAIAEIDPYYSEVVEIALAKFIDND